MPTDTTEKGLETLIMRHMTGEDGLFVDGAPTVGDTPDGIAVGKAGGSGWIAGIPNAYERLHCFDTAQLFAFLRDT
ncbi:MAG: hypothetical protein WEB53_12765 [Akkermansiaceae bacterium]